LARAPFAAKTLANEVWIYLDFLGFSRPNRAFSMGYTGKSTKIFSRSFSLAFAMPEWEAAAERHGSAGLFMSQA